MLVEKLLAACVSQAEELAGLVGIPGLTLMPAHTFLYSPAVNKVPELIGSGELGEIYFPTFLAHEPRHPPARPRGQRPRAARPVDPAQLDRRPVTMVAASGSTVFQSGVRRPPS